MGIDDVRRLRFGLFRSAALDRGDRVGRVPGACRQLRLQEKEMQNIVLHILWMLPVPLLKDET